LIALDAHRAPTRAEQEERDFGWVGSFIGTGRSRRKTGRALRSDCGSVRRAPLQDIFTTPMAEQDMQRVTAILARIEHGDESASGELFPILYDELRRLAASYFGDGRGSPTLQPTALVHEAYVKLAAADQGFRGRDHFMAVAALAMRQVLSDHARRKRTDKRGAGAERVTLDEGLVAQREDPIDLVALDDALAKLEKIDARSARVAELRLLSGLQSADVARILGVTERTVQLDWRAASAWLERELGAQS
jgi:RNA polymerase sigma factor (TIGR02999 family)